MASRWFMRTIAFSLVFCLNLLNAESYHEGDRPLIAHRQVDNPAISNYLRRWGHAASVVNENVFICGGEISQMTNGSIQSLQSGPTTSTLVLPIDQSWTNQTLHMTNIPHPGLPQALYTAQWVNSEKDAIYRWGGQASYFAINTSFQLLWKYSLDSVKTGKGVWEPELASNPSTYSNLIIGEPYSAAVIGDAAICSSGEAGSSTDPEPTHQNNPIASGVLTYNMSTRVWSNDTAYPYNAAGSVLGATVESLEDFGARGLALFLGGQGPGDGTWANAGRGLLGLDNLTFYDPIVKKWYWQAASGDVPPGRRQHCSVTVKGDDDTYEIYMFGGANPSSTNSYSDLNILTIPGFTWFNANITTDPRALMQCVLAGNSQMILIGGFDVQNVSSENTPDPWDQGIAVFDLLSLSWKDDYDPNGPSYHSPQVVKDWYSRGGLNQVSWSSDEVKNIFLRTKTTPSTSPSSAVPTNTASSSMSKSKSKSSSHRRLGIILGSVFGAIFIVSVIMLAIRIVRRRGRARSTAISTIKPTPEMDADRQQIYEMR